MGRLLASITVVAAGFAVAQGAFAAASAQGIMYVREVRAAVKTGYVFRGVQLAEETLKLEGRLRFNGLHGGVAYYQPFEGNDFASEARVFGGWSPHWEDHGSPLDLELGFTWYTTPESAPGFADDSRFEPYAKVFWDAPLQPALSSYYDTEREVFSLEGQLTHFVPFGGLNGLEFGFDGGLVSPDDAEDHTYAQGSVDLVRNFLNGMEGHVGVRGAVSSENTFFDDVTAFGPVYDEDAKVWATIGLRSTF